VLTLDSAIDWGRLIVGGPRPAATAQKATPRVIPSE